MTIEQRIGIVGGNGWLGSAIASAAIAAGAVDPARLTISGRSDLSTFPDLPGVHRTNSNAELVRRSDVVILSVGPAQFPDLRIEADDKLVVSVMAGITAARIAAATGSVLVVRAIPNAAAAIGRSFTPWYATPPVGPAAKAVVETLFEACGEAAEVPEEAHIDYCVGMTGSGAAFPALLAEALIADAVARGLPAEFARRAATGVLAGAGQLLAEPGADAARIVQAMIDYRGTTAAALLAMRQAGFDEAVAAGLAAGAARAAALADG